MNNDPLIYEQANGLSDSQRIMFDFSKHRNFSYRMYDVVLSQFPPKFREMAQYNALANTALEMLVRGADPYSIMEHLIIVIEEQNKELIKMVERYGCLPK
jgi:hypothetical protein